MKNIAGIISGFVLGVAGFLFLFKLIVLDNVSPEDELAPGIVVFVAIVNGFLLAWLGGVVQNRFVKKRNYK
jgi:hypothetical protein